MIKMAYFSSIWKARIIEQCRQEYENEKINSILTSKTEIPRKTIMQKWRFYGHNTKRRLRKLFPDGSSVSNLYFYLKSDHAFPNLFVKSAIGFVGGIALTYLCFIFFVYQLSISYPHATIMSSIIGVLLTLGLAFSWRIRCLIFLLIPQMFSRVGRYTLTCYALVLILTGPATNTLRNSEVLTESMACSQEQIKMSVRHISETVKKPLNAVKRPIKLIMDRMKRVASEMNTIVLRISDFIINIGDFIQSSFAWLSKIAEICTKKFGTPHDQCISAILQGNVSQFYNKSQFAETVCRHVGSETVCTVADYATASFSATLKRKLRVFIDRIKTMLYINIDIHHTHVFSNNNTGHVSPIAAGLVTDIRKKADPLLTWLSWSSCITSLFLLLIIFRAKYYQHMFETRSRFDNRYVTQELRELDLKRCRERRVTVLPLNKREQAKYISTTSFNLVASEKVYLTRSMVFMAITTFKLLIHMVADYSLYWVLITIRYHGNLKTPFEPGHPNIGIGITGSGMVADFIRCLMDSITLPLLPKMSSSTTCLPKPHPPDLQRYTHIGILIILLWFFALFEPYGLRLRHIIMGHYQPERAKARALWLFNHILRTRGSFMKLARRRLHREYKYSDQEHLTFRYWINSVMPCSCFKHVFGVSSKSKHCLLCNTLEELNDFDTQLTSCETLKCPGVYCVRCFSDIGRLCTICLSPAEYGDVSDVSLEKGSSDSDTDDDDNEKYCSINGKNSERENLIKKPNVRKNKKRNYEETKDNDPSRSNEGSKLNETSLSLLNNHELGGDRNRLLVGLSYGSLEDIGDMKNRNQYGVKEIHHNMQNDIYYQQYGPRKSELQNDMFNKNLDDKNMTDNKIIKRSKISKLAKFLIRKRVKMKHKKRALGNIAVKDFFKLLYKRLVPLEKYPKASKIKYIKICTVQKKNRLRRRSQLKLIFTRTPCKPDNRKKEMAENCKYFTKKANNASNVSLNYTNTDSHRKRHTRKSVGRTKERNFTGYKIDKVKTFYKLSHCVNQGQVINSKKYRIVPNKINFKRRKKRDQKKEFSRKVNIKHNNITPITLFERNRYKEALSVKNDNRDDLDCLRKLPVRKDEVKEMENNNNVNSYCDISNNIQCNTGNPVEKTYKTLGKIKEKSIRTPIPFMKEICIWLTSVLSIRRYDRRNKEKNTAEKGALTLPFVKSRLRQCHGEILQLNSDTIHKDDKRPKKSYIKPRKEFAHKPYCESVITSSSKLSFSDTKSNTTICSCFIMEEYFERISRYNKKNNCNNRNEINTEVNKDTFTGKCKLCDVSMSTDDWWSALEER